MVTVDHGIARITWEIDVHRDGLWSAVDVVRREVEAALAAHPDVHEAVVVAHSANGRKRLVGYGVATGSPDLKEFLGREKPTVIT